MNQTCFHPERIENIGNKNNCPVNIRFVTKTSDIRNFSENIRSGNTGYKFPSVASSVEDRLEPKVEGCTCENNAVKA